MGQLDQLQQFVSNQFYYLLVFTLIFGMLLYGFIGFDYTDEFCALFLFALFGYYVFNTPDWRMNKAFIVVISIFIFYLLYSFFIHSNTKVAIVTDFLIQIKPYLAFFCVYSMAPVFSLRQKSIFKIVCGFSACFLFLVGLLDFVTSASVISSIFGHVSYFAAAVISTAVCFFLCSDSYTLKDRLLYLLILGVGLFSTRAKFYGFFVLNVALILYFYKPERLRLTKKNVILVSIVLALMILVAWNKLNLYFIQDITAVGKEQDQTARFVLYYTSFPILIDYFPLGSGFASFATFASGEYYSDIYTQYGIENVWGISKSYYSFIADTYYPSLAQFGVVGVLLYASFWIYIICKAFRFWRKSDCLKDALLVFLIVCYFAIEGIADSTFTTHRGFFIMMLLGFILSDMKVCIKSGRK